MNNYLIRLIIYIVAIILGAIFRPGEMYRYSQGPATREQVTVADRIRLFLRRKNALKKCKEFIYKKKRNTVVIRNDNLVLAYDRKNKILMCINTTNIKMTASVEWEKQINYMRENKYDNTFELVFDNLCISFDKNTTYSGVLRFLKQNFDMVTESSQTPKENVIKAGEENSDINLNYKPINLNEASENALANMPGINIATAKKIIRRINTKGDYLSVEQMCKEMKIKDHFRIQLCNYLCAEPVIRKKETAKNNDDRIIDL